MIDLLVRSQWNSEYVARFASVKKIESKRDHGLQFTITIFFIFPKMLGPASTVHFSAQWLITTQNSINLGALVDPMLFFE